MGSDTPLLSLSLTLSSDEFRFEYCKICLQILTYITGQPPTPHQKEISKLQPDAQMLNHDTGICIFFPQASLAWEYDIQGLIGLIGPYHHALSVKLFKHLQPRKNPQLGYSSRLESLMMKMENATFKQWVVHI